MSTDKTSKNIPRRKFIKDTLTGIAGAGVMLGAGPALANPDKTITSDSKQTTMVNAQKISLTVNGKSYSKKINPETTLADFLRNDLKLTGTKIFCGQGECGSCTVLLNNKPVYSCHMLALDADGQKVLTIEGLSSDDKLSAVQQAFIEEDGLQCGFCTPGQIMSAYALLLENPGPTKDEIVQAMSGNMCRCGAYPNIIKSVEAASLKTV